MQEQHEKEAQRKPVSPASAPQSAPSWEDLCERNERLNRAITEHFAKYGHSPGRPNQRLRFREYALVADEEPDAEPVLYAVQCCVCEERSELDEDPEIGAGWFLAHLRGNPEHFTCRSLKSTPVRAQPGDWL